MSSNPGGIGLLIGLKSGPSEGGRRHAEDVQKLRQELADRMNSAQFQEALKEAAGELHEEIVQELRDEAQGRLSERRLSDPKNGELRNEVYADKTARALERMSGGQRRMSRISIDRVKHARTIK